MVGEWLELYFQVKARMKRGLRRARELSFDPFINRVSRL